MKYKWNINELRAVLFDLTLIAMRTTWIPSSRMQTLVMEASPPLWSSPRCSLRMAPLASTLRLDAGIIMAPSPPFAFKTSQWHSAQDRDAGCRTRSLALRSAATWVARCWFPLRCQGRLGYGGGCGQRCKLHPLGPSRRNKTETGCSFQWP